MKSQNPNFASVCDWSRLLEQRSLLFCSVLELYLWIFMFYRIVVWEGFKLWSWCTIRWYLWGKVENPNFAECVFMTVHLVLFYCLLKVWSCGVLWLFDIVEKESKSNAVERLIQPRLIDVVETRDIKNLNFVVCMVVVSFM